MASPYTSRTASPLERSVSSQGTPATPQRSTASPPAGIRGSANRAAYSSPNFGSGGKPDRVCVYARVRPPLEAGVDLAVRTDGEACQARAMDAGGPR